MKNLLLIVALVAFTISGFSQFKLGVRAGSGYYFVPQSSTSSRTISTPVDIDDPVSGELLYPKTNGLGYSFGLFVDIPVTKNIAIQIEPSYSFRTYTEVLKSLEVDSFINIQSENYIFHELNYLEIPILFKYNLKPNTGKYGRKSYFSVFAGPQIGLFLSKSEENRMTSIVNLYGQTTVNTEGNVRPDEFVLEYNTIDVQAVAGLMYDFEKGLRFGVRYVGSIMPVNSNINFNVYHHSIQATVGFNFIPQ